MSKRLFVGGLSWNTDEDGLRRAFESFGEVDDVKVITDRDTGRSRGFGFVTLLDDAAGERAIQEMDGTELDGRTIRVNEAQERAPRGGGGGGRGGPRRGGGGRERW
jgi:cold-inducible RNA-binding protein